MKIRTASVALALFLASCGGDDSSPSGGPVAGPTPAPAPAPPPTGYERFDALTRDTVLSTACYIPFINESGPGSSVILRLGAFGNLEFKAATNAFAAGSFETEARETFADSDLTISDPFVRRYEKPSAKGEEPQVLEFSRPTNAYGYVRETLIDIDDPRDFDIKDFCVAGIATDPSEIGALSSLEYSAFEVRGVTLSGPGSNPTIESAAATLAYDADRGGMDLIFSFSGTLQDETNRVQEENVVLPLEFGAEEGAFLGGADTDGSAAVGPLFFSATGGLFGPQAQEIGFVLTVERFLGSEQFVFWLVARKPAES